MCDNILFVWDWNESIFLRIPEDTRKNDGNWTYMSFGRQLHIKKLKCFLFYNKVAYHINIIITIITKRK
jgi:hypothetical protein